MIKVIDDFLPVKQFMKLQYHKILFFNNFNRQKTNHVPCQIKILICYFFII